MQMGTIDTVLHYRRRKNTFYLTKKAGNKETVGLKEE
jgi:hypothetical protein